MEGSVGTYEVLLGGCAVASHVVEERTATTGYKDIYRQVRYRSMPVGPIDMIQF